MDRPYVLHIFTPGSRASPFDVNMAADAGWQIIVPYPDVALEATEAMTQDTIFSRGIKGVARTGIFIGGRDALLADAMLERAKGSMWKPFVVSLMADPSGAYTTAAAMVARVDAVLLGQHGAGLAGRRVVVLGGLGPVGRVAGVLAARLGARVALSSRGGQQTAETGARQTGTRFGVELHGASAADAAALRASIADAEVLLACAAVGVQVLAPDDLACARHLRVAADLNAVAPAGIAGIGAMDDGAPLASTQAVGIGALAVGNIKYQTQHRLLLQLRDSEGPQALGLVEAFEMARSVVAEQAA